MGQKVPQQTDHEPIDLKDPWLALFLAWLLPGLGHLYQGRKAKAGLFFVCIMSTFLYGLYLSSDLDPNDGTDYGWGRAVYFTWEPGNRRWAYLCQVGVGLPALPALAQANWVKKGEGAKWNGFMAPPAIPRQHRVRQNAGPPTANDLHYHLHPYLELGKYFTMIAGLLNILAMYDAWGGPVFPEKPKKKEDAEQEAEDPNTVEQSQEEQGDDTAPQTSA